MDVFLTRYYCNRVTSCRWGTTPLDEGRKCGGRTLAALLDKAKADELAMFPDRSEEVRGKPPPLIRLSRYLCKNYTCKVTNELESSDEDYPFLFRADKIHPRRCSVFPYHPWQAASGEARRKEGVVLWIPHTIEGLVASAQEKLGVPGPASRMRVLSEDGARVLDVDMVNDGQKLYLVGGEDDDDDKKDGE